MRIPKGIKIANLPTPVSDLDVMNPDPEWARLYIKRDDFTGMEMSGNKVRKLEFLLREAMDQRADVLITCGGLQSNHARATASLAAKFSLGCHLVLRGVEGLPDGNYLLDQLFGARFTFVTPVQYADERDRIMGEIKAQYAREGKNAYVIPEGGSCGIGLFGYYAAYREIVRQERRLGIRFDAICSAEGSGGTYAGLYMANEVQEGGKRIIGFNIYGRDGGEEKIRAILREGASIARLPCPLSMENIQINYDYIGAGYGETSPELARFIRQVAGKTGIIVDPVYTGKALMGVVSEIKKHNPLLRGNVLFIHTGGQMGLFPQKELFA